MSTSRTLHLLRQVSLRGLLIIGSVVCGAWLMRAIVSRQGNMPYWMDISTRHLLAAFGNQDPDIDDIMDTSLLVTFLLCWFLVSAAMLFLWRIIKRWRAHTHQ